MEKMIAYCGLDCSGCPTFLATQNDDDAAREKIYSMKFGFNFKPEEINCDGCLSVDCAGRETSWILPILRDMKVLSRKNLR